MKNKQILPIIIIILSFIIFLLIFIPTNDIYSGIAISSILEMGVLFAITLYKMAKNDFYILYIIIAIVFFILSIIFINLSPKPNDFNDKILYISNKYLAEIKTTTELITENTSYSASTESTTTQINPNSVVYITKSGSKYHTKDCYALKGKTIELNILDAIDMGKTPCKKCNPK